jgi:hypothetical protein
VLGITGTKPGTTGTKIRAKMVIITELSLNLQAYFE